jgi:hypothetical protein
MLMSFKGKKTYHTNMEDKNIEKALTTRKENFR